MSIAPSNASMLSQAYKASFVVTSQLEEDLKYIRKLNTLFIKLDKTGKEAYVQEIVNILRILGNSLYLDRSLSVFYNMIDSRYHLDMEDLIFQMMKKCS